MQALLPRIWGLDIGGANLKCADSHGFTRQREFALWKHAPQLPEALRELLPDDGSLAPMACAVTMTGELADCFATKSQGIDVILSCVEQVCGTTTPVYVYGNDGRWYTGRQARQVPQTIAAANWHALAAAVAPSVATPRGLLVDVGSTTVDLIPVTSSGPQTRGKTDTERLLARELIYMGVIRTPVCGLLSVLPYRGQLCPIAREWFATTVDAYLVLGQVPEDLRRCDTADGRAWSRGCAVARLARMVCADQEEFHADDAMVAAEAIWRHQQQILAEAMAHCTQASPPEEWTIILAGEGEFLAREVVTRRYAESPVLSLSQLWGPTRSQTGPAYAVARLLQQALIAGTVSVDSGAMPSS